MSSAPIVLVPGFWLGAWAWDEVVAELRTQGHDEVVALTLPGLESADADRLAVRLEDHVEAIVAAVRAAGRPVVLAVHSGAGASGYAATDRVPEQVARMVYVDTGAPSGPLDPSVEGADLPMPSPDELAQNENLDGLTDEHLARFHARAVPEPASAARDTALLTDDARLDVPTTVVCTAFSADEYREAVVAGYPFLGALADLRDLTYVELRTSHWPMWSRPVELAAIIGDLARDSAA